jgi:WD40 repeat protein
MPLRHFSIDASIVSAIFRRWRSLRRRSRAASALLAISPILFGVWIVIGSGGSWPTKTEFRAPMAALPLGFSPDGRSLLTYGRDGITSWDAESGRRGKTWAFKPGDHPEMGTFSPDGKTYAAGIFAYPGPLSIDLFDAVTGLTKASLPTSRGTIVHLAFDVDGQTVRAFLGDDPQQKVCSSWNPAFGADLVEVVTLDAATGRALSKRPITAPTRGAVTAISPDGRILAIADRMKIIQLWDLERDVTLGPLINPATTATVQAGLGFSPDGKTLAIGRTDGAIELWDVKGQRLRKTLRGHTDHFIHIMFGFSPDGRALAVNGYRRTPKSAMAKIQDWIRGVFGFIEKEDVELLMLDIETGQKLAIAKDSTRPFYSPDGKTLATEEPDGSTRLRSIPKP